jgi:hypothetical protein
MKLLKRVADWVRYCFHNCHVPVLFMQAVIVVCLLLSGWFVREFVGTGYLSPRWVEPLLGLIGIALGFTIALSVHRWRLMKRVDRNEAVNNH